MTVKEFSDEFDALVNSYRRFKNFDKKEELDSIEFDEYEKSIFLTTAQEKLISSFYNGKNVFLDSFEKTEEIRRYLSELVKTEKINILRGYKQGDDFYEDEEHTTLIQGLDCIIIDLPTNKSYYVTDSPLSPFELESLYLKGNSVDVKLPEDLWFITYEGVKLQSDDACLDDKELEVIPVTQDTFFRTYENPFKTVGKRRVFRLDISDNTIELVSKYNIKQYVVRYLEKPKPIILEDLPQGLSIEGVNQETECVLNSALHRTILEQAVELALKSKGLYLNNNKQ